MCVLVFSKSEHSHCATHGRGRHQLLAASALKNAEVRAISRQKGSVAFEALSCFNGNTAMTEAACQLTTSDKNESTSSKGGKAKTFKLKNLRPNGGSMAE